MSVAAIIFFILYLVEMIYARVLKVESKMEAYDWFLCFSLLLWGFNDIFNDGGL